MSKLLRWTMAASPSFDPTIRVQTVALIEHSDTTLFKLSELRKMYQKLMSDQGCPCRDKKEPHSTRFKDHLLKLLPEWAQFSKGNEGWRCSTHQFLLLGSAGRVAQMYITQMVIIGNSCMRIGCYSNQSTD